MYKSVIFKCPQCNRDVPFRIWSSWTDTCGKHICGPNSSRILDPKYCEVCKKRVDCLSEVEQTIVAEGREVVQFELSLTFLGGVLHDPKDPTLLRLVRMGAEFTPRLNGKIYFYHPTYEACRNAAIILVNAFKKQGFRAGMRRGSAEAKGVKLGATDYYVWADKMKGR